MKVFALLAIRHFGGEPEMREITLMRIRPSKQTANATPGLSSNPRLDYRGGLDG
jgi:hypothetical protein